MSAPMDRWLDQEAGPFVRPYAVTKGRTMPALGRNFGLIDVVVAAGGPPPSPELRLAPEHRQVLARCQRPITVVDLASEVDLPIGVVRVLLSDLTEYKIVEVLTAPRGRVISRRLLNAVLDGLEEL